VIGTAAVGAAVEFWEKTKFKGRIMDDSWEWFNQTRKLLIAAFEAGEIDYQQYINMNQKALRKILTVLEKCNDQELTIS
jgi:hypothetical protein